MGAVGPDSVVELINGRFGVYDKTGNLKTATSLDQFWMNAGVTPTSNSFDPRIVYDDVNDRWFAASVDNAAAANSFLVAVSNSDDPTAGWTGFKIDSDADDSHWADFPTLGMNQDVVTLSANMFPIGNGAPNSTLVVLPKSDLLAPTPTVANRTMFENVASTETGFTPQPVFDLDSGSLPLPILSAFNKPAGTLKTSSITGTPVAPTLNTTGGMITVTARGAPPNVDQPGPKTDVDAGDTRFGSNVVMRKIPGRTNPSLWAVEGVDINGRAAIEWYEIDSVTNAVLQNGTIEDPSLAYNYPSIAVNELGDVAIGFSGGDPSTFMSTYVVTGETVDGVTTLDPVVQTHAGVADYENLDGIGRNRWGDYSATVIDPTDSGVMWTFQEFASGVDQWSIWMTEIIFSEPTQVRGTVWQDENRNGQQETDEPGVANWTVYLDANDNGQLDASEPSAVTNAVGDYVLETGSPPGFYTIAQVLQPQWEQTFPVGGTNTIHISQRGEVIDGVNFGNRPDRGAVSGIKWNDLDHDGRRDPDEPGIAGVYIYADLDGNGSIALGEPAAITKADGTYHLSGVRPGQITIREVFSPGWTPTSPALGFQVVTVNADATTPDVDFGNATSVDYGDAPAPYPTLASAGGASHGVLPGLHLGALIDGELDGFPSNDATGDDLDNLADEDGVDFNGTLFAGKTSTVDVTVSTGAYTAAALQAWVDFNADGDWNDAGEQIVQDMVLDDGVHTIAFAVPADAAVGTTFARFRYAYERGLGPAGPAAAGEVEDYSVLVLQDRPVATDDQFEVAQDSTGNTLDVLANDFPSSTSVLTIIGVTQPGRGQVTISPDRQTVLFTPNTGIFSPPNEEFTYTISDGAGKTDSATVAVSVTPTLIEPLAVDDAFRVATGSTDNVMPVLDNDLSGILGTMRLLTVTAPGSGSAAINNNGTPGDPSDDFIVYTPDGTFATVDQFQYTIGNANGTSTATVTVFEDPAPADQPLDISIDITDPAGNPISQVQVDSEFVMVVSVQDMRGGLVDKGVAAAYLDVLYDRALISPNQDAGNPFGFEIEFSPDYSNAKSGSAQTPGILDEVGGFQTSGSPLGDAKLALFQVTFRANAVGTVEFTGDPADVTPDHDILFFDPPAVVPMPEVHYGFTSLTIVDGGGSGEADGNPMDVNGDGKVSPIDALMVINGLNASGPQRGPNIPNIRLDVNQDKVISPVDALLVVNFLNFHGEGEGEGAGEGEAIVSAASISSQAVLPELPIGGRVAAAIPDTLWVSADADDIRLPAGAAPVAYAHGPTSAASVPLAELDPATPTIGKHVDVLHAADRVNDPVWESLLNELAEDVLEAWLDGGDA